MIKFITFDCYDTLVAYSAGKAAAIRAMVADKGGDAAAGDAAVARFGAHERAMHESPDFQSLDPVLRTCLEVALTEQGLPFEAADGERIVESVKESRPFDDVAAVLRRLKEHYRLAILSNSEPAIIRHNIAAIGVEFDRVVLAAEVGAYKPDHRMFHALLDRCGCDRDEIVHVAQGFYHDIMPGHALGLRRVWINRNGKPGDETYGPYEELPDLTGLPKLLGT